MKLKGHSNINVTDPVMLPCNTTLCVFCVSSVILLTSAFESSHFKSNFLKNFKENFLEQASGMISIT